MAPRAQVLGGRPASWPRMGYAVARSGRTPRARQRLSSRLSRHVRFPGARLLPAARVRSFRDVGRLPTRPHAVLREKIPAPFGAVRFMTQSIGLAALVVRE